MIAMPDLSVLLLLSFGIVVSAALLVLFRKVAALRQDFSDHVDAIRRDDRKRRREKRPDESSRPPSPAEVTDQPWWQQGTWREPDQAQPREPEAPWPSKEEGPRSPDSIAVDRAVTAYNALAAGFGQTELRDFEQRWHPEPVTRSKDNRLADDPQGDLWLIRIGDSGSPHGLVVPGPEVVRKWELYYRSMGSLAAKNLLGGLYEVGDNAPLRLRRPAVALKTQGGWRVETPGTFADH
jgi:hypothetical protein